MREAIKQVCVGEIVSLFIKRVAMATHVLQCGLARGLSCTCLTRCNCLDRFRSLCCIQSVPMTANPSEAYVPARYPNNRRLESTVQLISMKHDTSFLML